MINDMEGKKGNTKTSESEVFGSTLNDLRDSKKGNGSSGDEAL